MKAPKYIVPEKRLQAALGLNAFALELVAESYADKPELFNGESVLCLNHAHNGTRVSTLIMATMPTPADFDLVEGAGTVMSDRPKIICLCGSTRFIELFAVKTWELELEGHIVLGRTLLSDWYCAGVRHHFAEAEGVKEQRDEHHLRKIDLSDEVLVLNKDGYVGESTRNEIAYAIATGKPVRYLEALPVAAEVTA